MSFFGFGQSADIDIVLDGAASRRMTEVKTEDGKKERLFLYYDGESVSGKVNITLKKPGVKLEHQGIKIEFIGQIELYYDRGNHHEFTSLVKELARPGELQHNASYDFDFSQVEKPYESYTGINVKLRYFLKVTIVRRLTDIVKELDLAVHTLSSYPEMNSSIKMEVGIEDSLHIEFEYNKSKYHLKDVIVGKIYFLLVRIKIRHMEIAIIRRETTGSGPNIFNENETIAKYEIMDGSPVRGESIPIRVFLAGYDLTPTMRDINKKFSVRYYLNLVLVDEEDRRYFKQQEITLWRKGDRARKSVQAPVPTPTEDRQDIGIQSFTKAQSPTSEQTTPADENETDSKNDEE
nr:EOG090X05H4 [Eulimnadia texana]